MTADDKDNDQTKSFVALTKGTTVSHYKIIEKIGSGGMGEVYLAQDIDLDRRVALKFLPPHLCQDEECRSRFRREAQAAARLDHANIVTVHEVGGFHGRPYFVMQHIEGRSLRDVIKHEELSLARIISLTIEILEGLREAHEADIVHRDIKPSNILIDGKGRPKLVDFGLAAIRGTDRLTKTGSTLGTMGYMSPEQIQGKPVDRRSDIFSIGVVLYEMIAGQPPFEGDSDAAIIYSVVNEAPVPLAQYSSIIPELLQVIVDKTLSKDPNTRYQSADELTADLKELREKSDVDSPTISGRNGYGKHIALFGGIGLLLVLMIFSILTSSFSPHKWLTLFRETTPRVERRIFELPIEEESCVIVVAPFWGQTDKASEEGKVMQALIEREIFKELESEEHVELLGEDITEIPRSHKEAKTIGEKYDAAVVIWGEVIVLHEEVEIQPYMTFIKPGMSLRESPAPALEASLIEPNQLALRKSKAEEIGDMALMVAAKYYYRKRKLDKALAVIQRIDKPTSVSLSVQGDIRRAQGKEDVAEGLYKRASSLDSNYVWAHHKLGGIYLDQGKYDAAIEEFQKALALDPENESVLITIAKAYSFAGKNEQAIVAVQQKSDTDGLFVKT